jgi:hypothetical protein
LKLGRIVNQLEKEHARAVAEVDRIAKALEALNELNGTSHHKAQAIVRHHRKRRRKMSAAAKRAISAGRRRYWKEYAVRKEKQRQEA